MRQLRQVSHSGDSLPVCVKWLLSIGPGARLAEGSPTLKRYHQQLWSKPLPDGRPLDLSLDTKWVYMHHSSGAGEFTLSSDSVIPTWDYWKVAPPYMAEVPRAS